MSVQRCACGRYTREFIAVFIDGGWQEIPFCTRCRRRDHERQMMLLTELSERLERQNSASKQSP